MTKPLDLNLLRLFAESRCLRFGLPGDEAGWQRLQQALATLKELL